MSSAADFIADRLPTRAELRNDPGPMPEETRMPNAATRDHAADALSFVRATYVGDGPGRAAIARNCDPVGMVDAMAATVCAVMVSAGLDPLAALDWMLTGVAASAPEDWTTT